MINDPGDFFLGMLVGGLAFGALAISCGKQALPPGCTEADFAALAATCPSESACNNAIDDRHKRCSEKVEAE